MKNIKRNESNGLPLGFENKSDFTVTKSEIFGHITIPDPFGNCQTFCARNINSVFQKYQTNKRNSSRDPWIYDLKEIAYFFIKAQMCASGKHQILIDIHDFTQYHNIVEELFKDNIVVKAPYTSTNGSKMCIYLLKLQGCINYINDIEKKEEEEAKRLAQIEKERLIASGQYKEPEFTLPEKWFIVSTKENNEDIKKWINNNGDFSIGNFYTHQKRGLMYYVNKSEYVSGYIEITYEQFKKYVLKEESNTKENIILPKARRTGITPSITIEDDELPF